MSYWNAEVVIAGETFPAHRELAWGYAAVIRDSYRARQLLDGPGNAKVLRIDGSEPLRVCEVVCQGNGYISLVGYDDWFERLAEDGG